MEGFSTNNAPSPAVVLPHYIFAALSFLVLAALTALSSESLLSHYFNPVLLSLTHIAALGWASMIIFGALYQLLPVILQVNLYSEKLAITSFILLSLGTIIMAWSFWKFSIGYWLQTGAILAFSGIIIFAVNIFFTANKNKKWNIDSDFIMTAVFWLLATGIIGILMVFNFRFVFLPESHLLYLKIHAHTGVIGWLLLLIIGVGSKLLPMFMLSHKINETKLKYAYYLINSGLILLIIHWLFFPEVNITWFFSLMIVAGIMAFISFVWEAYSSKLRKSDIGMKQSFAAIFLLFLPLLLGLFISSNPALEAPMLYRVYMVYGFSAFFGLTTSLILGQTLKTLPFIVWLSKYKSMIGKTKIPLPKELYSERIARWQYRFYLLAIALFIGGILMAETIMIKSGAMALLTTAVLYNINVFKILFHSAKKPAL
ncbi:MAG: hypothetical protein H0X62_05470 [Bacteroidetes bacterium]|nr:hypothetical protein [Bacteroidota bacterium]